MSKLAMEIFDAFDDGEFRHEGDFEDIDPELKYTCPKLEVLAGGY